MGWSEDTWTISSGIADEEHFLSDMTMTVAKEVDMMRALLPQDERLYVQVYSYTDRIAHVLWRFMDPGHPLYDAGKAPRFQEEVKKAYVRMDGIVSGR